MEALGWYGPSEYRPKETVSYMSYYYVNVTLAKWAPPCKQPRRPSRGQFDTSRRAPEVSPGRSLCPPWGSQLPGLGSVLAISQAHDLDHSRTDS
jgi:hypothetical protein